jgi:catalase
MDTRNAETIETRKVAVLVDDGYDSDHLETVRSTLQDEGARVKVVSKVLGDKEAGNGDTVEADKSHVTTESVLFDAVFVPGGAENVDVLLEQGNAKHFVAEMFKHKKPIAAMGEGIDLLGSVELPGVDLADEGDGVADEQGVVMSRDGDLEEFAEAFVEAISAHRHWERDPKEVPA